MASLIGWVLQIGFKSTSKTILPFTFRDCFHTASFLVCFGTYQIWFTFPDGFLEESCPSSMYCKLTFPMWCICNLKVKAVCLSWGVSKLILENVGSHPKDSSLWRRVLIAFRIPEKVSTSPNYKYRRDALRNREARRKLDGWECEQCKNVSCISVLCMLHNIGINSMEKLCNHIQFTFLWAPS